jgi:hypothetical protein
MKHAREQAQREKRERKQAKKYARTVARFEGSDDPAAHEAADSSKLPDESALQHS